MPGVPRAGYVLAGVGLVALLAWTRGGSSRLSGWLRGLGELSYPVYLLHPLAWVLSRAWLPATTPALAALGVALATTFALALVVYHGFDRPIRDWLAPAGRTARVRLLP